VKLVNIHVGPNPAVQDRCPSCGQLYELSGSVPCPACLHSGFVLDFETLEQAWAKHTLPQIKNKYELRVANYASRRESWKKWMSQLLHEGKITHYQHNSWPLPRECWSER
jgi:hypothetical protein